MSESVRFQNGISGNWVKYLTEKDFAAISGFSTYTIQQWRFYGKGPKYRKIGTNVRYLLSEIQEWMDENIILPRNASDTDAGEVK
jgi:predicted DNA-binding transcriptional regulator AlpA